MLDLDLFHTVLLMVIGFGAGLIQRVCGFGIGIFSMLFLPHFLPSHTISVSFCSLVSSMLSGYNAFRFRRQIPYRVILPPLLGASVTIPIAIYFAATVPQGFLKQLLGAVLVCLSIFFLFFSSRLRMRPTFRNGLFAGSLGGILNGLFAAGAPPVVMYLTSTTDDKDIYFAATQFYFFFTNVYSTGSRLMGGLLSWSILVYSLIGLIGCLAGNWLGGRLVSRIDAKGLKTVIYIGMALSGILMIL